MCANDLPSFLAPLPSPYLILSVAQMEDESRGFVELGYVGRYTEILKAKMANKRYEIGISGRIFTNIQPSSINSLGMGGKTILSVWVSAWVTIRPPNCGDNRFPRRLQIAQAIGHLDKKNLLLEV